MENKGVGEVKNSSSGNPGTVYGTGEYTSGIYNNGADSRVWEKVENTSWITAGSPRSTATIASSSGSSYSARSSSGAGAGVFFALLIFGLGYYAWKNVPKGLDYVNTRISNHMIAHPPTGLTRVVLLKAFVFVRDWDRPKLRKYVPLTDSQRDPQIEIDALSGAYLAKKFTSRKSEIDFHKQIELDESPLMAFVRKGSPDLVKPENPFMKRLQVANRRYEAFLLIHGGEIGKVDAARLLPSKPVVQEARKLRKAIEDARQALGMDARRTEPPERINFPGEPGFDPNKSY